MTLLTALPASVKPVKAITSGRPRGTGGADAARSNSGPERGMSPCYEPSEPPGAGRSRSERTRMLRRMDTMAFPDLEYRTTPVRESEADALLLALPPLEGDEAPDLAEWPGLRDALSAFGFTGATGAFLRVFAPESTALPLAVVGTGAQ